MSKAPVTSIKGDAEQTCKKNEHTVKNLEMKLESYTQQREASNQYIEEYKKDINKAKEENNRTIQTRGDRVNYLRRAIQAAEDDQERFRNDLANIHETEIKKKEEHQKNLEKQHFEQQEMENDLKSQIQEVVHQLKSLRGFQELKHALDQQIRTVRQMVFQEKKEGSRQVTEIHHKILDQREFYEKDLESRLSTARDFAKEFADLHMDQATDKIMSANIQNRRQLKEESSNAIQQLRQNDELRKKLFAAEQLFKINQKNVETLHYDYATLKVQVGEFEERLLRVQQEHKERIRILSDDADDAIGDLKLRIPELQQKNGDLQRELERVSRQLKRAEISRSEEFQKECEVLDQMNQTAGILLTAIDRAYLSSDDDEKENSAVFNNNYLKSRNSNNSNIINGRYTQQKSELGQLVQRLQTISQQMKEKELKNNNMADGENGEVRRQNRVDAETQTEKPIRSDFLCGKVSPPPIQKGAAPRRKTVQQTMKPSPVYKRLFEASKRPTALGQAAFPQPA